MEFKASDWMRLDTRHNVDQQELAHMCSMSAAEIDELVDYGVLVPLVDAPGRQFNAAVVPSLEGLKQAVPSMPGTGGAAPARPMPLPPQGAPADAGAPSDAGSPSGNEDPFAR